MDWDEPSPPLLVIINRNGEPFRSSPSRRRQNAQRVFVVSGSRERRRDCRREASPCLSKQQVSILSQDALMSIPRAETRNSPNADFCPALSAARTASIAQPADAHDYIPARTKTLRPVQWCGRVHLRCGQGVLRYIVRSRPFPCSTRVTDHFGEVQAWNVDTGGAVPLYKFEKSNWGAMLATAGGLSSAAAPTIARSARSTPKTAKAREFPTSSGVEAPVTTYLVDGKQYLSYFPAGVAMRTV